jgi:hypothetical protein
MTNKIFFTTGLPAKNRLRINGHGMHQLTVKIPKFANHTMALVTSSDFSKDGKIMLYPDIVKPGEAEITIINLSPYPIDLEEKNHIGTLVPFSSRCSCDCNTKTD